MINEKLLQYIQENRTRASKTDIQSALLQSGWKLEDIEAAFAEAENPSTIRVSQPQSETASSEAFLEEMRRKRTETSPVVSSSYQPQNTFQKRIHPKKKSGSGIIGFLIEKNIVADEKQANYLLIGVFIIIMSIAVWITYSALGGGGGAVTPGPDQMGGTASSSLEP